MEEKNSATNRPVPISRLAAWLVLVIGALVLIGWAFDIPLLKSIRPQWNSMKVITACCLLASAASLAWLQAMERWKRGLGRLLATFVCAMAVINLVLYAVVFLTGHDPAWANETGLGHVFGPTHRMAVIAALVFFGLSIATLLLGTGGARQAALAHVIVMPVALLSYLVLVGYLLNVPTLDTWLGVQVAFHTAIAQLALCVGLLFARTDTWFTRVLTSREAGGTMARRVLPIVAIFPLTFAWLKLEAERKGWFHPSIGVALVAIANTTVLFWLVWLSCRMAIRQQRISDRALQDNEQRLRVILDALPVAVFLSDRNGNIVFTNSAVETIWGMRLHVGREEYGQYPGRWLATGETVQPDQWALARTLDSGEAFINEPVELEGRDGTSKLIYNFALPIRSDSGQLTGAVVVTEDVTERTRAHELIRQAKETAEKTAEDLARSNADLEQFAYVASHDLQEPLRAVAGFMGMLKRQYTNQLDEKAQQYIGHAIEGAERMQALVNDLLTFSRVGTKGGAFARIPIQAALNRALDNLRIAIEESNAQITSDELPEITADASQMAQLLQNLIANAIKFRGERQPRIHISSQCQNDQWTFCVSDNGIGIEAQYFDRIFLIFQRLHSRTYYSGTGIGLAVCKKIVERHGGTIGVESKPGEGSTFCFTIPDRGDHL